MLDFTFKCVKIDVERVKLILTFWLNSSIIIKFISKIDYNLELRLKFKIYIWLKFGSNASTFVSLLSLIYMIGKKISPQFRSILSAIEFNIYTHSYMKCVPFLIYLN
jgi:hypothetical protein